MKSALSRFIFISVAYLCISFAVAGVFLPLLPTTPFLIAAMVLLSKANPAVATRLENSRLLGGYIKSYTQGEKMAVRTKLKTIALLWVAISISIFFVSDNYYICALLVVIAIAVTIHISRR